MKTILFLLSFMFVSCMTSGVKTRAVASEACTIENYKDFIHKQEIYVKQKRRMGIFWKPTIDEGICNLEGADLEGMDLQGANLRKANLDGANLRKSILIEANLDGANLRKSILIEANLQGANLYKSILIEANLQGANLQGAYLALANFTEADLTGAKVTSLQAEYLTAQGLSGFVVVE